jgi:hypothetical protein
MKQQINEIKRMQQLAGIIRENYDDKPSFDLDRQIQPFSGDPDNLEKLKQIVVEGAMSVIKHVAEMFGTDLADQFYLLIEKAKKANTLEELGDIYTLMEDILYENTDVYTSMGVGKKDPEHHQYGDM